MGANMDFLTFAAAHPFPATMMFLGVCAVALGGMFFISRC